MYYSLSTGLESSLLLTTQLSTAQEKETAASAGWQRNPVEQFEQTLTVKERLAKLAERCASNPYSRDMTYVRTLVPKDAPAILVSSSYGSHAPLGYYGYAVFPQIEPAIENYVFYFDNGEDNDYFATSLDFNLFLTALNPIDIHIGERVRATLIIAEDGSLWSFGYGQYGTPGSGIGSDFNLDPDSFCDRESSIYAADLRETPVRTYLAKVHDGPFVGFVYNRAQKQAYFLRHADGSLWAAGGGRMRAIPWDGVTDYGDPYTRDSFWYENLNLPTVAGDIIDLDLSQNYSTYDFPMRTPILPRPLGPVLGDHIVDVAATDSFAVAITKAGTALFWGRFNGIHEEIIDRYVTQYTNATFLEPSWVSVGLPIALETPPHETVVAVAVDSNAIFVVTDLGRVWGVGYISNQNMNRYYRFGNEPLSTGWWGWVYYNGENSWSLLWEPDNHNGKRVTDIKIIPGGDAVLLKFFDEPNAWYAYGGAIDVGIVDGTVPMADGHYTAPVRIVPNTAVKSWYDSYGHLYWQEADGITKVFHIYWGDDKYDTVFNNSEVVDPAQPYVRRLTFNGQPLLGVMDCHSDPNNTLWVKVARPAVPELNSISSIDISTYYRYEHVQEMRVSTGWVTDVYTQVGKLEVTARFYAPFVDVSEKQKVVEARYNVQGSNVQGSDIELMPVPTHYTLHSQQPQEFEIDFISSLIVLDIRAFSVSARFSVDAPFLQYIDTVDRFNVDACLLEQTTHLAYSHTNSSARVPYETVLSSLYAIDAQTPYSCNIVSLSNAYQNALSGHGLVPSLNHSNLVAYGPRDTPVTTPMVGYGPKGMRQLPVSGVRQMVPVSIMGLGAVLIVDNDNVAKIHVPDSAAYVYDSYAGNGTIFGSLLEGVADVRLAYVTGWEKNGIALIRTYGSIDYWPYYYSSVSSSSSQYDYAGFGFTKVELANVYWGSGTPSSMIALTGDGRILCMGSAICNQFNSYLDSLALAQNPEEYALTLPEGATRWVDFAVGMLYQSVAMHLTALDSAGRLWAMSYLGNCLDSPYMYGSIPEASSITNARKVLVDTGVREFRLLVDSPSLPSFTYLGERASWAYLKDGALHVKGNNPKWVGQHRWATFKLEGTAQTGLSFRLYPSDTLEQKETLAAMYTASDRVDGFQFSRFPAHLSPCVVLTSQMHGSGSDPRIDWPVVGADGWKMLSLPLKRSADPVSTDAYHNGTHILALPESGGLFAVSFGKIPQSNGLYTDLPFWAKLQLWAFDTATESVSEPYVISPVSSALPYELQEASAQVVAGFRFSSSVWALIVKYSTYSYQTGLHSVDLVAYTFAPDHDAKTLNLVTYNVLRSDSVSGYPPSDVSNWYGHVWPAARVGGTVFFGFGRHLYSSSNGTSWTKWGTPLSDDTPSGRVPSTLFGAGFSNLHARQVLALLAVDDSRLAVAFGDATLWVVDVSQIADLDNWAMVMQPVDWWDTESPDTISGTSCRRRGDETQYTPMAASLVKIDDTRLYLHSPDSSGASGYICAVCDLTAMRWQRFVNGGWSVASSFHETSGVWPGVALGDITGTWNSTDQDKTYAGCLTNTVISAVGHHPAFGYVVATRGSAYPGHLVLPHPDGGKFIGIEEVRDYYHYTLQYGLRSLLLTDDRNDLWVYGSWDAFTRTYVPKPSGWVGVDEVEQGHVFRVYVQPVRIGSLSDATELSVGQAVPTYAQAANSEFVGVYVLGYNAEVRGRFDAYYRAESAAMQEYAIASYANLYVVNNEMFAVSSHCSADFADKVLVTVQSTAKAYANDSANLGRFYINALGEFANCSVASLSMSLDKAQRGSGLLAALRSIEVLDDTKYRSSKWVTSTDSAYVVSGGAVKYLPVAIYVELNGNANTRVAIGLRDSSIGSLTALEWWLARDYLQASFNLEGVRFVADFGVWASVEQLSSVGTAVTTNLTYRKVRRVDCFLCIDNPETDDLMVATVRVPKIAAVLGGRDSVASVRVRERSSYIAAVDSHVASAELPVFGAQTGTPDNTYIDVLADTHYALDGVKQIDVHAEIEIDFKNTIFLPPAHCWLVSGAEATGLDGYEERVYVGEVIPNKLWVSSSVSHGYSWYSFVNFTYLSSDGVNWRAFATTVTSQAIRPDVNAVGQEYAAIAFSGRDGHPVTLKHNGDLVAEQAVIAEGSGLLSSLSGAVVFSGNEKLLVTVLTAYTAGDGNEFRVWSYANPKQPIEIAKWSDEIERTENLPWAKSDATLPAWMRQAALFSDVVHLNSEGWPVGTYHQDRVLPMDYTTGKPTYVATFTHKTLNGIKWRQFVAQGAVGLPIRRHSQYPSRLSGFRSVWKETPTGRFTYFEVASGYVGGLPVCLAPTISPVPVKYALDSENQPRVFALNQLFVNELKNEPGTVVLLADFTHTILVIIDRPNAPMVSYWVEPAEVFGTAALPTSVLYDMYRYADGIELRTDYSYTPVYDGDGKATYAQTPMGNTKVYRLAYSGSSAAFWSESAPVSSLTMSALAAESFGVVKMRSEEQTGSFSPYRNYGNMTTEQLANRYKIDNRKTKYEIDFKFNVQFDDVDIISSVFVSVHQQLTENGRTVSGTVFVAAGGSVVALERRRNVWIDSSPIESDGSFSLSIPPSTERIYLVAITNQGEVGRIILEA